jgi:hypothetical protein
MIVQGILQLFIGFLMEIHILQMICKCSNHRTDKECVGFLIGLLMLISELAFRLVIGYPKHTHDSQPKCDPRLSSLELHASERC